MTIAEFTLLVLAILFATLFVLAKKGAKKVHTEAVAPMKAYREAKENYLNNHNRAMRRGMRVAYKNYR